MVKKIVIFLCILVALGCVVYSSFKQYDLTFAEEVDMEIYGFEHEGHEYMMFEENGHTVGVIHNPDCNFCNEK